MARKERIPSAPQARALARMWSDDAKLKISDTGDANPTHRALIKYGWIDHAGSGGQWPSGALYTDYAINDAGIDALEGFLRQRRYDRTPARVAAKVA